MMDFTSGDADSLILPIVTRLIPPGMGDSLAAFCRTLEAASQSQSIDQAVVATGLQILLSVPALPLAPAVPGVPWMAWELAERDDHGSVLRVESAAGDGLSLHRDATGTPTVASWERLGTEQAATFYLTQGAAGWELGIDTGVAASRHPVTMPAGITWASAVTGGGTLVGVVAGAVGSVIAAAATRTAPPAKPISPTPTTAPAPPPESAAPPPAPAPPAAPPTPALPPKPEPVSWHYLYEGQTQGPVAEDVLRGWFAEDRLPPDTLVWNSTLSDWRPAQEVGLVTQTPAKRFCGQCGAPVTQGARFCGGCGNTLA